jgi:hypothetical protein
MRCKYASTQRTAVRTKLALGMREYTPVSPLLRGGSKRVVPDEIYSAVLRADRVVPVQVRLHVRVRGFTAVAVGANVRRNGEHAQEVTDGQ